tara:strand:- start:9 stop:1025 length:1017 start_codon:yes stop_codon:yes gene_type:complete
MHFKTKLFALSIIVIGACILQIVLDKGVYEGFTGFNDIITDDNKLSFNQYDRKYNKTKDCNAGDTDFAMGQYVEYLKDGVDDSVVDYYTRWASGIVTKKNDNIYSIKLSDGNTINVESNRIKNHHQNVCNESGYNDNECSNDCIAPVNIGGNCLPVQEGKDKNDNVISYQVCPMICRNDNVNVNDLECGNDNGCRGCGFSVFEVKDNIDNYMASVVVNKLTEIPYTDENYTIDTGYIYADEMAKETKRTEDALAAMTGSSETTSTTGSSETASTAGSSETTSTTGSSETASSASVAAQDTETQETSNVVNAITDTDNCWLGPTGHDAFMYCGPAPFSF